MICLKIRMVRRVGVLVLESKVTLHLSEVGLKLCNCLFVLLGLLVGPNLLAAALYDEFF